MKTVHYVVVTLAFLQAIGGTLYYWFAERDLGIIVSVYLVLVVALIVTHIDISNKDDDLYNSL